MNWAFHRSVMYNVLQHVCDVMMGKCNTSVVTTEPVNGRIEQGESAGEGCPTGRQLVVYDVRYERPSRNQSGHGTISNNYRKNKTHTR